ncbi:S41 family peptidase [Staphylococcus capitis]|uniref:S41 family peptidase n=1 Tax=Staphylococcus capitis TaxID=29388 RepID=UPI001D13DF2A|nr:S41 family peptidase [Staphylococcus capitis]MCC3756261.1 S41 family peptidase [Staphylococcus capitis]MDH8728997.1 S41 family peptidase [Staphylococcus capitis]MDH8923604.1 S41 family peptidase [Staphylococcus capitis]MDH8942384.1 S41 family peptidase [Staphylococcus capitis]MDH9593666.1 S41 family peptidase [Staphylococcus capitis]
MKKLLWISIPLVIVFLLFTVIKIGPLFNFYLIPPSPKAYAKNAIDQMELQGLYAKGEKWEETKSKVLKNTKHAKSYKETHPYIEEALRVAGRKHSFLEKENNNHNSSNNVTYPKTSLNHSILTIKLPEFTGKQKEGKHYANIVNHALQKKKYDGVILDLRNNTGGDMGPMIAGVSSLIKNGKLMTFIDKDNNKASVKLDGSETENGGTPVKLKHSKKVNDVPIAILLNNKTASSGEITSLSFKGNKKVKYFGQNTAGYTSSNTSIKLYDNAIMNLTTHKIKDNTGHVYENNPIQPDSKTNEPKQDAMKWLKQQSH